VNAFLIAATAMLAAFIPILVVCLRGQPIDAVVALELAGAIATTILLCLAQGFARSSYLDLPVAAAVLSAVSGLVFARFLGRHI
jgi:multisubunit Na+/H+ antiporter MnhF subunit